MKYSVYDIHQERYLIRSSREAPQVLLPDDYMKAPMVSWEDVWITLPKNSEPAGVADVESPKGIVVHPKEVRHAAPTDIINASKKSFLEVAGLFLLGGGIAWRALTRDPNQGD